MTDVDKRTRTGVAYPMQVNGLFLFTDTGERSQQPVIIISHPKNLLGGTMEKIVHADNQIREKSTQITSARRFLDESKRIYASDPRYIIFWLFIMSPMYNQKAMHGVFKPRLKDSPQFMSHAMYKRLHAQQFDLYD